MPTERSPPCASCRTCASRATCSTSPGRAAPGRCASTGRPSTASSTSSSSFTRTGATSRSRTPATRSPRRARSATSRCSSCPATGAPGGWTAPRRPAGRAYSRSPPAASGAACTAGCGRRPGVETDEPLPLLVVHDGPEYDELAQLTTYLSALIADGRIPPLRAALLAPGPADDWYSANGAYTRALCLAVLPHLKKTVATTRTIGMGASLGALAMLHAHRGHAGAFDALFLQSGSFFHAAPRRPRAPLQPLRPRRAGRRHGAAREGPPRPRARGAHLRSHRGERREQPHHGARARRQGYDVALHEVRDVHNYVAWRDAFDPHLTGLLRGDLPCGTPS